MLFIFNRKRYQQFFICASLVLPLLLLSACTLPMSKKTHCKDRCVYDEAKPCPDKCIEDALNDLRCQFQDGNCYAAVCLGQAFLTGCVPGCKPMPKDFNRAFCWFKKAADNCIAVAEVQLGHMYRDGLGTPRDPNQARCWYERAAQQGDITGMIALAEMYKGWNGIKCDLNKAAEWYRRAICCGSKEAEYQLGLILARQSGKRAFCKGIDIVTSNAEMCNPEALLGLGDLYYEGRVGGCNLAQAMDYYERAAKLGSAEAAFKLGMIYASGTGVPQDPEVAGKWFFKAANGNFAPAELQVANILRQGLGVPKDYHLSAIWYNKAAEHGIGIANVEIADMYLTGRGLPRILEEAVRHYKLALTNCSSAYAYLMLSVLYEEGRGVPFNVEESVAYYQKAKKMPCFLMEAYRIGRYYQLGQGLPHNILKAIRWYTWTGEKGLVLSQIALGDIFYDGSGSDDVEKDYNQAFFWYQQAAVQGNAYAQYMVGIMNLLGQGTPEDPIQGAEWIRKAAYRGEKPAQYQLGLLYLKGAVGVQQNDLQAYAWLKTSLDNMLDAPPTVIRNLVDGIHPDLRAKAVELAKLYRKKYQTCRECPMPCDTY